MTLVDTGTNNSNAQPVDADDEEFVIGGEAGELKSKYDFEGAYNVEITALKPQVSSKGSDMIVATLVGQEGPATGLVFTDYMVRFKLAALLKTLDVPHRVTDEGKLAFAGGKVIGRTVVANFKREQYNDKWSAKVAGYQTGHTPAASSEDIPF